MKNPRIYFKIQNDVLVPVISQDRSLYKMITEKTVMETNKSMYNDYTKNFIAENTKNSDVFWSEVYSWDPDTLTFNFAQLTKNTPDDWTKMMSGDFLFDKTKKYTFDEDIVGNVTSENLKNMVSENESLLDTIKRETPCPDTSSGFYFEEPKWNIIVRNIKRHQNTMLVGPTGAGKTDVIIRACKMLNVPCRVYDMGAMMDPLTDLLGSHRLENGSSKFDYAKFVQDVQEPGVILLDELSRAPVMTNNILFPCLDDRRELPVDIADSKSNRRVKIHPEVTFIATANIGPEYSGTSDIDAALANRFMTIQVGYLPEEIETKILNVRTGIDVNNANRIVSVANAIRNCYFKGDINKPISTRETIACAELFVDGFSLVDAIDLGVCQKYQQFGSGDDEYTTVKRIVMGF